METAQFSIAAIVGFAHAGVDGVLADFVRQLQRDGWRVRGLIQQYRGECQGALIDVDAGTRFPIFQDLGLGSTSCRVDSSGVADASVVLRQALLDEPDLVVANRFGALEAEGSGLAAEMLAVMSEGIPFLTVVSENYLPDWRRFTGGSAIELPPRFDALRSWFHDMRAGADSHHQQAGA